MFIVGITTKNAYARLQDLIATECGFQLDAHKTLTLRPCIKRRMGALGLTTYDDYLEYIDRHKNGMSELKALVASITVNETNFYRHPDQFVALKDHVIPEIIDQKLKLGKIVHPVASIWSAGCSSGDETYTIALQVREAVDPFYSDNVEILGTDIDENVLAHARKGIYTMRTLQFVSRRHINAYFERVSGDYRITDRIRGSVQFKYHNLVDTPYPRASWDKWDVIFCRNVIIYFDKKTVSRVIDNLYDSLAEGGYLFLGYSESLNGISDKFSLCKFGKVFAYRKDTRNPVETAVSEPFSGKRPISVQACARSRALKQIHSLLQTDRYDDAEARIERLLRNNPDDATALTYQARVRLEKGEPEAAMAAAFKAIELEPLQTHAHFIVGVVQRGQGEFEQAVRYLRRSLYLDDTLVMAHIQLAAVYQKNGRVEEARREYKNAIRLLENPNAANSIEFSGGLKAESILEMCRKNLEKT